MKHKHCELIKAWADGAEIEAKGYFSKSNTSQEWATVKCPDWNNDWAEYRIKPEPKPDVIYFFEMSKNGSGLRVSKEYKPNLKLIFDGETGELKSAEVLK